MGLVAAAAWGSCSPHARGRSRFRNRCADARDFWRSLALGCAPWTVRAAPRRYASLTRAWGEHDPRADIAPAPPPLQEKRGMSPTLAKGRLRHTRLEIPAKRGHSSCACTNGTRLNLEGAGGSASRSLAEQSGRESSPGAYRGGNLWVI